MSQVRMTRRCVAVLICIAGLTIQSGCRRSPFQRLVEPPTAEPPAARPAAEAVPKVASTPPVPSRVLPTDPAPATTAEAEPTQVVDSTPSPASAVATGQPEISGSATPLLDQALRRAEDMENTRASRLPTTQFVSERSEGSLESTAPQSLVRDGVLLLDVPGDAAANEPPPPTRATAEDGKPVAVEPNESPALTVRVTLDPQAAPPQDPPRAPETPQPADPPTSPPDDLPIVPAAIPAAESGKKPAEAVAAAPKEIAGPPSALAKVEMPIAPPDPQVERAALPTQPAPNPLPPSLVEETLTPFAVGTPKLCRKIVGFGDFEPLEPGPLRPGQAVLVYCELSGLRYQARETSHVSRLSSRLMLHDRDGTCVWEQSLGETEDECRSRRRDNYLGCRITLPASLAPGDYRLRIVETDLVARQSASAEIPVSVVR